MLFCTYTPFVVTSVKQAEPIVPAQPIDTTEASNAPKRPRGRSLKYRPGLRVAKIAISKEKRRLLNVLHRDTEQLLMVSHKRRLNKDESQSLIGYLRLIKDLEKQDPGVTLDDAALAKLAGS
jgi:hypothetical protein